MQSAFVSQVVLQAPESHLNGRQFCLLPSGITSCSSAPHEGPLAFTQSPFASHL